MEYNKKSLPRLDHTSYEHPFDRKALNALERTPGLTVAGKYVTKQTIERVYTVQYTGSNLRVTAQSYPMMHDYLRYACHILGVQRVPELYVQWGYGINAFTVGAENPIVVLDSGLMDLCDEDEKLFVIGHELGHIKSNHMLYHMMAQLINYVIDIVPGGSLVAAPLRYALLYWDRMSEFTADRAGMLCCQNRDAAVRAFVKMAGLPISQYGQMNVQSFLQQAKDFDDLDYENLNRFFKLVSILDSTHPWTVMRAAELIKWIDSGAYSKLLFE